MSLWDNIHRAVKFGNRFEVPKTLLCRASAQDVASGTKATFFRQYPTRPDETRLGAITNEKTEHTARFILSRECRIIAILSPEYARANEIPHVLEDCAKNIIATTTPKDCIVSIREALEAWSRLIYSQKSVQKVPLQKASLQKVPLQKDDFGMFENMHGVVLVVHTSGVSAITLGKARICLRGNRIRLRNIRSLEAIKDTIQERLQDRIKSGIETRAEKKQTNHSDWSWNVGDEEIPCHYEQYELQGMTRLVAMASDVWLPSDVGAITRAGLEARGGRIHAATEAMRQAFITLGERPRGAVLAIDIAPHEADTPDYDDIVETIRTTTKISKVLKSASILGFSIGQVSTFMVVVGIVALIGYGVWDKYVRGSEGVSASDSTYYGNRKISPQSSSKMPQTQAMRSDTANLNTMDDNDTLGISSNVAPHTTNTATILGFEKSSRTRIPVILSTPKRLTSTELARNVRVSITGPQRIEKYRLEADTARQGLPPNAQRVNIIVEEPLAKGRYTVQLSYRADETSNAEIPSATVNVNIIEKPRSSAPSTFTVFSLTRTIYFGTQMVMGNRQLAVLRKKAEAVLGGSIEGLLPEMSFAYRFITRSGDTTAVQHFPFDQNNVRGIQRGWYVSSSIASVEAWLNYRLENGEDVRIGKALSNVSQSPPLVVSADAQVTWVYKVNSAKPKTSNSLNDIEVMIQGVRIDYDEIPIDNDIDGSKPRYASLKDLLVPSEPEMREPQQDMQFSIAQARLEQMIAGVDEWRSISGYILIYDGDEQQILPENIDDVVTFIPQKATFESGRYSVKFLISNLPKKPKNEEWHMLGRIIIGTNARIRNPLNQVISRLTVENNFAVAINIVYK